MYKSMSNGLIVGLTTITVGIGTSILSPKNPRLALISSGLGAAISSTVLAQHREKLLLELKNSQLQDIKTLSLEGPTELSSTRAESPIQLAHFNQKRKTLSPQVSPTQQLGKDTSSTPDSTAKVTERTTVPINSRPKISQNEETVTSWLLAKEITVVGTNHKLDPNIDRTFDKHAIYLGNNLKDENNQPLLSSLLKQIKWSISNHRGIQYHLKRANQLQIRTLTQFCYNLHRDTLLSSYRYSKTEKTIHAIVQDRKDIRSFFNGAWFERFTYHRISELLQKLGLSYSYLMNPILKFQNGDTFELDLLFLVEGKPLLIECKTGGNFHSHLQKFSDHRKRLSIPPERAFLVILDLENSRIEELSNLWKFKVINQDKLISSIQTVLRPGDHTA